MSVVFGSHGLDIYCRWCAAFANRNSASRSQSSFPGENATESRLYPIVCCSGLLLLLAIPLGYLSFYDLRFSAKIMPSNIAAPGENAIVH